MIGEFITRLLKKNAAPEWFCRDIRNKVPEAEIKEKIRIELGHIVDERAYDRTIWTDEFVVRMAGIYYKFFDQLYMLDA